MLPLLSSLSEYTPSWLREDMLGIWGRWASCLTVLHCTWEGRGSSSTDDAVQACFLHNQARQLGPAAKGTHAALPALCLPLGFRGLRGWGMWDVTG